MAPTRGRRKMTPYSHTSGPRAVTRSRNNGPSIPGQRISSQGRSNIVDTSDEKLTKHYGDYWQTSTFKATVNPSSACQSHRAESVTTAWQDVAVYMTQDLFIMRPDDPITYMQTRLADWVAKGQHEAPQLETMKKMSDTDIALGHDYLDKHNVRYLMVELGLRTMRQRPSENKTGVCGFLGDALDKDKEGILKEVDYLVHPDKREREQEAADHAAAKAKQCMTAAEAAEARLREERQARHFKIQMYNAKRLSAINRGDPFTELDPSKPGPKHIALVGGSLAPGKREAVTALVVERLGLVRVSAQELLQSEMKAQSMLGRQARMSVEAGREVVDEVMCEILHQRLSEEDCHEDGWLLEDYPKTPYQVDLLQAKGHTIHTSVVLAAFDAVPYGDFRELCTRLEATLCELNASRPAKEVVAELACIVKGLTPHQRKKCRGLLTDLCSGGAPRMVAHVIPGTDQASTCQQAAAREGLVYVNAGDLLRAEMASGSTLGRQATAAMGGEDKIPARQLTMEEQIQANVAARSQGLAPTPPYEPLWPTQRLGPGELPEELMLQMVKARLSKGDCRAQGFILEGFPRCEEHAKALANAGMDPSHYVVLSMPSDMLMKRITGRRLDPQTGVMYMDDDGVWRSNADGMPATEVVKQRLQPPPKNLEKKMLQKAAAFAKAVVAVQSQWDEVRYDVNAACDADDVRKEVCRILKYRPFKIVIAGPPAAGKGTQCEKIAERYGVVHISTGDILRAEIKMGTKLGTKAKKFMDNGKLVPDDVVIGMVKARLESEDCIKRGWLLDGFPRTGAQAAALEAANIVPNHFLSLNVHPETLVERCIHRRLDPETGKIYHLKFKPPPSEVEARLIHRADDTAEKVMVRYKDYKNNFDAIAAYYERLRVDVNGEIEPGAITDQVHRMLENRPRKIVIAGPPAAGKGTQCEKIAERYGVVHISTGDILRAEIKMGTKLGTKAKKFMDNGKLVPDDVVIGMVKARLESEDCIKRGWLLDGFPRTGAQAAAMTRAGIVPENFLVLDVHPETLVERCIHRRLDPETGQIYHLKFKPPPSDEIAERLQRRPDDTEEKIKLRIGAFNAHIAAIAGEFADVRADIPGEGLSAAVWKSVMTVLEATGVPPKSPDSKNPKVEAVAIVTEMTLGGDDAQLSTRAQIRANVARRASGKSNVQAEIRANVKRRAKAAELTLPLVINGPSGVGKGTLINKLMAEFPDRFGFSVSHTTRGPRQGEEDGTHYHFSTHEKMEAMIANSEFVEFAHVHGNIYGTSKAAVEKVRAQEKTCILDIDVQGAEKVKKAGMASRFVFIKPPSMEELEDRLRGRGTETEDKILKRLANAKAEMAYADRPGFYSRIIVNDDLEKAYAGLCDFLELGKKSSFREEIRRNVQRRVAAQSVQEDVRGEISQMLSKRIAGGEDPDIIEGDTGLMVGMKSQIRGNNAKRAMERQLDDGMRAELRDNVRRRALAQ